MAIVTKDLTEVTDPDQKDDLEKGDSVGEGTAAVRHGIWLRKLITLGVEIRGIVPVPLEERTDKRGIDLFSLWFTSNCSLLP